MGARMLRDKLALQGDRIGRRHVARLMRVMGIEALYAQKSTSRRHPQHFVFQYLLRDITIEKPNHVWCADITYIPMERGFLYLFAVMDWATRRILAWRLSNSLTTDCCIDALEEAVERYGPQEMLNTDQGVQFTSSDFVQVIREKHGIALSMDGKVARQCHDRALLAIAQIRRSLSACLRWHLGREIRHREIRSVL